MSEVNREVERGEGEITHIRRLVLSLSRDGQEAEGFGKFINNKIDRERIVRKAKLALQNSNNQSPKLIQLQKGFVKKDSLNISFYKTITFPFPRMGEGVPTGQERVTYSL
jgi:hypothetical protein